MSMSTSAQHRGSIPICRLRRPRQYRACRSHQRFGPQGDRACPTFSAAAELSDSHHHDPQRPHDHLLLGDPAQLRAPGTTSHASRRDLTAPVTGLLQSADRCTAPTSGEVSISVTQAKDARQKPRPTSRSTPSTLHRRPPTAHDRPVLRCRHWHRSRTADRPCSPDVGIASPSPPRATMALRAPGLALDYLRHVSWIVYPSRSDFQGAGGARR